MKDTVVSHGYLIHTGSDTGFVNRALPSLNGGSLKITLTVPLKWKLLL